LWHCIADWQHNDEAAVIVRGNLLRDAASKRHFRQLATVRGSRTDPRWAVSVHEVHGIHEESASERVTLPEAKRQQKKLDDSLKPKEERPKNRPQDHPKQTPPDALDNITKEQRKRPDDINSIKKKEQQVDKWLKDKCR